MSNKTRVRNRITGEEMLEDDAFVEYVEWIKENPEDAAESGVEPFADMWIAGSLIDGEWVPD